MKKGFLIIAHGSRKEDANQQVMQLTKKLNNYFQSEMFETAFMEMASPTIEDGIKRLVNKKIDTLVAYPFFLFKGMHYSKDVPQIIRSVINTLDENIKFKLLDPVGSNPRIIDIVQEELYDEAIDQFKFKEVIPAKIEDKSMELIERNLDTTKIPSEQKSIIKRVIHTTGDLDFRTNMIFQNGAIPAGLKAIREKKTIYTDVTMVQAGIIKKFGHTTRCLLNEPDVINQANTEGTTKAAAGIKALGHELDGNIIAIGNAPTALITLVDMVNNNKAKPALIVGIPVGFVNAKESKAYLSTIKEIPYITNQGQKGGSAVAAAIINALIKCEFH